MPLNLDKPVSSKLDLDDNFTSLDPVSVDDFSLSDYTDNETYPNVPHDISDIPRNIPDEYRDTAEYPAENTVESNAEIPEYEMKTVAPPSKPKIAIKFKGNTIGKSTKSQQTPQMLEVSADSAQPPVSPWKTDVRQSENEEITAEKHGKVNLEKPYKAAQMPAVRADSSQPPVVPWQNYEPPENAGIPPQNRKLGSGTVNFAFSDNKNIFLTIIAIVVVVFFAFSIPSCTNGVFHISEDGMHTSFDFDMGFFPFFITLSLVILTVLMNIIRSGEKWHYEITGREIIFSRKGRPSQIIFFKDALGVSYIPYKFLGIIETGYIVTVLTYGKKYEFKCVYPNINRKTPFELTPFEIIRKQIDQLGLHNPNC